VCVWDGSCLMVRDVTFLHLGKTGGTTIDTILHGWSSCIRVKDVHMFRPSPSDLGGKKVVVSTRDPIARVVSAFNYNRGIVGPLDAAASGERLWELQLYQCFKHVNEMAEALESGSHCGEVARHAFECCEANEHALAFIGQGLQFYTESVPAFATSYEYALTHSDTLVEDLERISEWLGCPPPPELLPHSRDAHPTAQDTFLSEQATALLRKQLAGEYERLERLESHAAVNGRLIPPPPRLPPPTSPPSCPPATPPASPSPVRPPPSPLSPPSIPPPPLPRSPSSILSTSPLTAIAPTMPLGRVQSPAPATFSAIHMALAAVSVCALSMATATFVFAVRRCFGILDFGGSWRCSHGTSREATLFKHSYTPAAMRTAQEGLDLE
jgi:hypothetical protein